jgi:hypothetical protein
VAALPANPPASLPPAPTVDKSSRLRDAALQQRELLKDPQYRKARIAQARVSVVRDNPDLAEELGLSEAEANRMFDLMAEHSMETTSSLMVDILSSGNQAGSNGLTLQKQQEQTNQRNGEIASLLGPEKYTKWQQYEQNAPARSQANSVNSTLSAVGQSLSPAQLKSFTRAMAVEQTAQMLRQRVEMAAIPQPFNPQDSVARAQIQEILGRQQEQANQRMLVVAQPIMSAQQLATLRTQFEAQDAIRRATARAREQVLAAQPQQ